MKTRSTLFFAISSLLLVILWIGFYFFGIGVLAYRKAQFDSSFGELYFWGFFTCIGILICFTVFLITRDLKITWIMTLPLAACGLILHTRRNQSLFGNIFWIFLALSFFYALKIALEPIRWTDARCIWFLHGRMLFYSGGLVSNAGWLNPAFAFSHPDYPLLVPFLSAQAAQIFGGWNEYFPKFALMPVFLPIMAMSLSDSDSTENRFFAISYLFFGFGYLLWAGCMDALLALCASRAVIEFVLFQQRKCPVRLHNVFICLALATALKNEGVLFAILFIPFLLRHLKSRRVLFFLYFLPALLWILIKRNWQITNDLQLGASSLSLFIQRSNLHSLGMILNGVFFSGNIIKVLAIVFLALALLPKTRMSKLSFFPIAIGSIYVLCISGIYMITPHDLAWHLSTSVNRTMLVPDWCFLSSIYLWI